MRVYCPYCKKEVEYKIEKRDLKEFRGIEVNTFENVARANEDFSISFIARKKRV